MARSEHVSHPIVELKNVSKHYPGEQNPALAEVSLSVYPGDFLSVLGPSGAGKSTLLHITGLVDLPTGGDVYVMGRSMDHCGEKQRARIRHGLLGFVFQFHYLLSDLTVGENVLLPLLINGGANRGTKTSCIRQMREMLLAVDLADKIGNYPHELSGGERQRVAVARALVTKPPLILADEPTGNLDTVAAKRVWDLLVQANKAWQTAVMAITHNENLAQRAGQIVRLVDGRVCCP